MHINIHLPADAGAASVQYSRPSSAPPTPAALSAAATTTPGLDLGRWQGLEGDATVPDSAGADQAAQFAQGNFLSQPSMALAAQANLNPDSVYSLLQTS